MDTPTNPFVEDALIRSVVESLKDRRGSPNLAVRQTVGLRPMPSAAVHRRPAWWLL